MVLGCIAFMVLIVAVSGALAALSRRPIGYMFLPAVAFLGITGSVLYGADLFSIAPWVAVFIGVVAVVVLAVSLVKKKNAARYVINSDIILFAVLGGLFILLNFGRVFALNDEFSHWGLAIKNMFENGEFYASGLSNDLFKDYPPFATAVCTLAAQFCQPFANKGELYGGFCEASAFVAMDIMILSCVMPFIAAFSEKFRAEKKNEAISRWCLSGVTALFAVAVLCFKFSALTIISVDTLIGLMAAAMLAEYFTSGSLRTLPLIAMALTMTKDIAIGFAVFAVVICFADVLRRRKSKELPSESFIKETVFSLCAVIFSILSRVYCGTVCIDGALVSERSSTESDVIGGMKKIFENGLSPVQKDTFRAFINAFAEPRMSVGIPLAVTSIILAALSVIMIIYVKKMHGRKTAEKITVVYANIVGGFLLYSLGVLVSYWTKFSAYEALQVASFERYFGTYMTFWALLLMGCFVLTAGIDFLKKIDNKEKKTLRNITAAASLAAGVLVIVFFTAAYPYTTEKAKTFRQKYESSEIIGEYYREGLIEKGEKVLFIPDDNHENIDWLMANYNGAPVQVVYLENWQKALESGQFRYAFKDGRLIPAAAENID